MMQVCFQEFKEKILSHNLGNYLDLIEKAYRFAEKNHAGQKRDEGTDYFVHPLRVAYILLDELKITDPNVICVALLHDILEDSPISHTMLREIFGEQITSMVKTLTKEDATEYPSKEERDRVYLERIKEAPLEVCLIKLSDRLDNVRYLHLSPSQEKQLKYYRETCEKYLPLAKEASSYLYDQMVIWANRFWIHQVNAFNFWENLYQQNESLWDLGQAAPPFISFLESPLAPSPGSIAVLGCGRGHDAIFFARKGFQVIGFDFAPAAIQGAYENAKKVEVSIQFEQRDLFDLIPEYTNRFDFVLEHTCFCAIDPARRKEYVQVVKNLLRPDGQLIALFYAHGQPGGPPYTTDAEEVRSLFSPFFEIKVLEVSPDSIERRQGKELFSVMRML
jgi:SAM-dependent methyltransferase